MKKILFTLAVGLLSLTASKAQNTNWAVDASHSNVKFSVTHMVVSEVEGSFRKFDCKVSSPSADFNNAEIDFSADVNSVFTDDDYRDKHLKGEDFFNAEKFPNLTFKSTSFKKVKDNNYTLTGNLTMRGVTKPITLMVTYGGTKNDPWGNTKAGFKIRGKLDRQDYGLNWKKSTEAGDMVVSDEVNLIINLEMNKVVDKK